MSKGLLNDVISRLIHCRLFAATVKTIVISTILPGRCLLSLLNRYPSHSGHLKFFPWLTDWLLDCGNTNCDQSTQNTHCVIYHRTHGTTLVSKWSIDCVWMLVFKTLQTNTYRFVKYRNVESEMPIPYKMPLGANVLFPLPLSHAAAI